MYWLHFIGRSYYTPKAFLSEAAKLGVCRRIDVRILKSMNLGDVVLCAQGGANGSKLLGAFIIQGLGGLSEEAGNLIAKSLGLISLPAAPVLVERRCGQYWLTCSYWGKFTCRQIAENLSSLKQKGIGIGNPSIIGELLPLENLGIPPIEIRMTIPFRPGFRPFDLEKLLSNIEEQLTRRPTAKRITVRGQFFTKAMQSAAPKETGQIDIFSDYELR